MLINYIRMESLFAIFNFVKHYHIERYFKFFDNALFNHIAQGGCQDFFKDVGGIFQSYERKNENFFGFFLLKTLSKLNCFW